MVFTDLRLPVVGAPMFLVSGPDLVVAQGQAGILGTFPALNARSTEAFGDWCDEIAGRLPPGAPWGVNLIAAPTNTRLEADLAVCVDRKVPVVITSLRAPRDISEAVRGYGGIHLHDVTTVQHAEKALDQGASGLVLVAAGAGGHAGRLSPFAFAAEVRRFFAGPLLLGGGIGTGAGVLAAQAAGVDAAYVGTRFIPATESLAPERHRAMILEAGADDIVNTPLFSGVAANYLRASVVEAGLDPKTLPAGARLDPDTPRPEGLRAWIDILSAGQGVASSAKVETAAEIVDTLETEYRAALTRIMPEGAA
ncbi:NAD(P)H-dependent flavin oxidoreductase [Nitratireductor alexandrii]|uniref:NAD(P)H-dependent flavin oxidoreductase n=1 Tax=Nitratireductor alexandrii TaxID=2448161 RepID=UPI000FDA3A78|nr:nitronate monooxygenase [Nitratireductor alexandrii]